MILQGSNVDSDLISTKAHNSTNNLLHVYVYMYCHFVGILMI